MSLFIVLFDGDCTLCNGFANFIVNRSKQADVASLQSDTARRLLKENHAKLLALNTLVLLENNSVYIKSDAVFRILKQMKGFWPVLIIFKCIPSRLLDKLYDIIAQNRHKFARPTKSCASKPNTRN